MNQEQSRKLIKNIVQLTVEALFKAREARVEVGIAENELEVEVTISKEEIKQKLSAERIHTVTLDYVAETFIATGKVTVRRGEDQEIVVKTIPVSNVMPNLFTSIDDLVKTLNRLNKKDEHA